jgi:hypothetical protein
MTNLSGLRRSLRRPPMLLIVAFMVLSYFILVTS